MSSPNRPQSSNNSRKKKTKKFGDGPSAGKLQFIMDELNKDYVPPIRETLDDMLLRTAGKDKVEEWKKNWRISQEVQTG